MRDRHHQNALAPSAEPTPVVTAFLHRGDRVLLFRRSEHVRTYRGKWAGVSGYLERMPLDQAWMELKEEAGLEKQDVHLEGVGVPLPVEDREAGCYWLVFPFLFRLEEGARIRRDWESLEMRWFSPPEMLNLETVPCLWEAFSRLWPSFGHVSFWEEVAQIAGDRTHGATDLAARALRALTDLLEMSPKSSLREITLRAARALASVRPSMGVFPHLMARVTLALGKGRREAVADLAGLHQEIQKLALWLEEGTSCSALQAAEVLRGRRCILTLSHSRACREALLLWAKNQSNVEVIVAESRPKREGLELARQLAESGLSATVITEAQMGIFAERCDAVLVGGDAITEGDEIVNKAGTRLAVLAAQAAGISAYAVCQTFKVLPPGWPLILAKQDPEDVARGNGFQVQNIAFDRTPLGEFGAVLTEEGPLEASRLQKIRRELKAANLFPGSCRAA